MDDSGSTWWRVGAVLAALGVALGAFGAHGLEGTVDDEALAWWHTGARYHLVHALAVLAVAAHPRSPRWSGILFTVGIVLFSGSLYVMTVTGVRMLGMITPLGGLCFLGGWGLLAATSPRAP